MTSTKARGLKTVSGILPHISRVYIWGGWQILEGILRRAKEYSSRHEIWCLNLIWQLETVWHPRFILPTHISSFSVMKTVFWNILFQKTLQSGDWPTFWAFQTTHTYVVSKKLSFTDNFITAFNMFCFYFKLGTGKQNTLHSNSNSGP